MEYYVYVIKQACRKLYYGQTKNIERRIREHSIDRYGFKELVFVQVCETRGEAVKLEKFFKSGHGREIIRGLFGPVV